MLKRNSQCPIFEDVWNIFEVSYTYQTFIKSKKVKEKNSYGWGLNKNLMHSLKKLKQIFGNLVSNHLQFFISFNSW